MIALILVSRFSTSFQFRFWLNPCFISLFFSTKSSHFISSHYTRRTRGWASPFHFTHFPRFIGSFSSGIDIETTTIWQKAEDQDQELSAPCMGGPIWGTQNIAVCEVLGSFHFIPASSNLLSTCKLQTPVGFLTFDMRLPTRLLIKMPLN